MCFGAPTILQPAAQQVIQPPPPPPPNRQPDAPELGADKQNSTASAAKAQRQGTSIFRNDLAIPTASSAPVGTGLNLV